VHVRCWVSYPFQTRRQTDNDHDTSELVMLITPPYCAASLDESAGRECVQPAVAELTASAVGVMGLV